MTQSIPTSDCSFYKHIFSDAGRQLDLLLCVDKYLRLFCKGWRRRDLWYDWIPFTRGFWWRGKSLPHLWSLLHLANFQPLLSDTDENQNSEESCQEIWRFVFANPSYLAKEIITLCCASIKCLFDRCKRISFVDTLLSTTITAHQYDFQLNETPQQISKFV